VFQISSDIAVDPVSGNVFFGSYDKNLYALDQNGVQLWRFTTGDWVS
jgi:outer membrane protein assembly factor BamB